MQSIPLLQHVVIKKEGQWCKRKTNKISSSKTEDDNRLYLLNNEESFHCIYNAMKNYADIEEIQRCCIVTVCTMMDIKESHEAIQKSLIEEMISLAMENFPNNKNIQEYGQTIIESFDLSDFFMKDE